MAHSLWLMANKNALDIQKKCSFFLIFLISKQVSLLTVINAYSVILLLTQYSTYAFTTLDLHLESDDIYGNSMK